IAARTSRPSSRWFSRGCSSAWEPFHGANWQARTCASIRGAQGRMLWELPCSTPYTIRATLFAAPIPNVRTRGTSLASSICSATLTPLTREYVHMSAPCATHYQGLFRIRLVQEIDGRFDELTSTFSAAFLIEGD